jgi:hypothetical protein
MAAAAKTLLVALAAALVSLASCGATARSDAVAPAAPAATAASSTAFAFSIWGDVRGDDRAISPGFQRVVTALRRYRFGHSVTLGDYIDATGADGTDAAYYDAFLNAAAPLTAGRVTHWTTGNHERVWDPVDHALYHDKLWGEAVPAGDPAQAQRHHWGTFSIASAGQRIRFFYLSTAEYDPGGSIGYKTDVRGDAAGSDWMTQSAQARALVDWLRRRERRQWVVVVVHHPLYDAKVGFPYDTDDPASEKVKLAELFRRYGVDLVVQGDVHNYRRHLQPDGVTYLTQGMGGAPPRAAGGDGSDDTPPLDALDRAALGSSGSGPQRYGWTLFRFDARGRLRGATFYVSDQPEVIGGRSYAAGSTIPFDRFIVRQLLRVAP